MQKEEKKDNWFKKVLISIKDFDKYENFAIDTTFNQIKYFVLLILLFSIIVYIVFLYKFQVSDTEGIGFFKKNILNLDYEIEQMQIIDVDSIIIQNKTHVIIPIWVFMLYLTTFLVDAVILGAVGYLIALIARIKIRYKAMFNMSIHALTLPILLKLAYIILNAFVAFDIQYFDLMYTAISYIYITVAILIIKTDVISRQIELLKIEEEQKKIRQELIDNEYKENEKAKEQMSEKEKGEEDGK